MCVINQEVTQRPSKTWLILRFLQGCRWSLMMRFCWNSSYASGCKGVPGRGANEAAHGSTCELGAHIWTAYIWGSYIAEEQIEVRVGIETQPWCAHTHKNTHISTSIYAGTQTHSLMSRSVATAVLWAPWGLWQYEDKKALEAPTRLLTNGRVDIHPGRQWAVSAAPTEMIQPAMWNTEESILMDEDSYVKDQ